MSFEEQFEEAKGKVEAAIETQRVCVRHVTAVASGGETGLQPAADVYPPLKEAVWDPYGLVFVGQQTSFVWVPLTGLYLVGLEWRLSFNPEGGAGGNVYTSFGVKSDPSGEYRLSSHRFDSAASSETLVRLESAERLYPVIAYAPGYSPRDVSLRLSLTLVDL